MTDTLRTQTMTIHVQDLAGDSRTIEGEVGTSLMEIIRAAGIDDIPAFCGGCCSCASCHVHVDAAFLPMLPAISADEADLLDGAPGRSAESRLSCQIPASATLDGIRLTIAPQD